jgi:YCII-related domain-containing protein
MSTFVFIYRAPKNYTPSEDAIAQWGAWFESMGDSVVDRGNRVVDRATLGGALDTVLGGYSLVRADDLDAAVGLAKGCPILEQSGGVEVGELMP